jgi:hypothetical protein
VYNYLCCRNFIDVRWFGFNDPQSGLAHFVWWAGTTPGGSEIMTEREIHVTEMATALNILPLMPVGKRIYVTVRAFNRAGKYLNWAFYCLPQVYLSCEHVLIFIRTTKRTDTVK